MSSAPLLGILQAIWMRQRGEVPARLDGSIGALDASKPITTLINSFEIGGNYQSVFVRS